MIWLFRSFKRIPFMADAIDIWAEADTQITALNELAHQVTLAVVAVVLSSGLLRRQSRAEQAARRGSGTGRHPPPVVISSGYHTEDRMNLKTAERD